MGLNRGGIVLEKEICILKKELNKIVDCNNIISEKVLKLSRRLDTLIVGYYNSQRQINT